MSDVTWAEAFIEVAGEPFEAVQIDKQLYLGAEIQGAIARLSTPREDSYCGMYTGQDDWDEGTVIVGWTENRIVYLHEYDGVFTFYSLRRNPPTALEGTPDA